MSSMINAPKLVNISGISQNRGQLKAYRYYHSINRWKKNGTDLPTRVDRRPSRQKVNSLPRVGKENDCIQLSYALLFSQSTF